MRNLIHFTRFGLKNGVYSFIVFLSILALFLSILTLSEFYPENLLSNTLGDQAPGQGGPVQLLDTIREKLMDQIGALETPAMASDEHHELKDARLKHIAFLAEILTLVGSLKSSLSQDREEVYQQQRARAQPTEIHPLSRRRRVNLDEAAEFFLTEEIRKYARFKPNRLGKQNFMGANGTFTSIGHGCFSLKQELEEYMDYDVGDFCKDDWKLAQRLMVHGCDPVPRRRCFARAPKLYSKPLPVDESIWRLPDDRNVRWSGYRCKSFACLAANRSGKGFFKCSGCFNLTHHERPRWIRNSSAADFLAEEVVGIKQGEIRIGLDFSVGTGTFAARMRELNATVVSATVNLGAPFSETIALRGLVPLYLTVNQRLPFFDNTLDMIHSTRFLDGWIDFALLDFVLYDWDRVLRPGGLLWIDSFFCKARDLEDYLEAFGMLRYKRHRWVVAPKLDRDGEEVFFSAVMEKPARPF